MRQKLRRLLSLVLVFSMTMSLLSLNVWAANGAEKEYDYVVTLDNAQEETPVEGLAAELLAQKGIADETGTWSSDNGEVLAIDEAWNAVAYRAGEVTVSYTYMAAAEPEEETPGEDLGVIPPEVPGEDEEDATEPGEVEDGEDAGEPEPDEGEDAGEPEPGEGEDSEDAGEPEPDEGEDAGEPEPGEGEDSENLGEPEPGEGEDSEDVGEPDKVEDTDAGDDTMEALASRVDYAGPEDELETVTVTWTVLVQDCDAIREIRALMHEMLEKYGDGVYGEGGSCQYSPEDLETALTFFHEKMAALEEAGIGWPGWPDVYGDDAAVLAEMLEKLGYGVRTQKNNAYTYNEWQVRSPYRIKTTPPAMYHVSDGKTSYYMYCAQYEVTAHQNTHGYTADNASNNLKNIVANGYNYALRNSSIVMRRFPDLSEAEALTATQAAIWHYTDGHNYTKDDFSYGKITTGDGNDGSIANTPEKGGYKNRIYKAYQWLIGDGENKPPKHALPSVSVEKVTATAMVSNGKIAYEVKATVKVENAKGLSITVSCTGANDKTFKPTKNSEEKEFTFSTSNPKGKVNVKTENVKVSEDTSHIYKIASETSQDMVGYLIGTSSKTQSFTDNHSYNVETYDVTINKTGDNCTPNTGSSPLAGATFAIDISKDTKTIPNWQTAISDGNGEVKFTGIPNGFSYTIRETAAPELYAKNETQITGSSATPSGGLSNGTFNNSLERGSLTIIKTVAGDTIDKTTQWEFTINLKLPGGSSLPGSYPYTITRANGSTAPGNISDGGKVSLAHDDKVTISDIPAGAQYSVTEAGADENGYVTTSKGTSGEIEADNTSVAEFTNTRFNGDLLVKKVVAGNGGDENQEFDFNITLAGTSASKKVVAQKHDKDGKYVEGENTWTFTDRLDFTLKHGEYLIIKDLPNGTIYTVTEKNGNGNGYTSEVEVKTDKDPGVEPVMMFGLNNYDPENYGGANTNDVSITREKVDGDRWNIVTFTNTRELGSLEISKKIVGNTSSNEVNRPWTFEITLTDVDGNPLSSQWTGYEITSSDGQTTSGNLQLNTDGKGVISLTHDQTLTFPKLPVKTQYAVKEVKADTDGYKTTKPIAESGSVENADSIYLDYTNAWTKGNLIVTKTMGGDAAADEKVTFEIALDLSAADILEDTGTKVDVKDLANWISGDDQTEDGSVTAAFADDGKTWVVTITKDVKTDGETIIAELDNIPTGVTYTVTETTERLTEEGYEVVYTTTPDDNTTSDKTTSGTITNDGEMDAIEVQDYRGVGTLEISKKVVSDVIIENAGEQFTFRIDLTNVPTTANNKEFLRSHIKAEITNEGEAKGVSKADVNDLTKNDDSTWTWEIKLVDGATATISGLPASTKYTVREVEANLNGYITTVMFNGDPVEVGAGTVANKASAENEQVDEFLCTNTRFDGNLAVMKVLDGEGAYDTDEFQFTMELTSPYGDIGGFTDSEDDVDPMGVDSDDSQNASWWANGVIEAAEYTIYKNGQDEAAHGALADLRGNDGRFRFMLRGGDLITFAKLPDEALYTVTEDTNNWNGYSTDIRAYGIMMFDDEDAAGEPEEETYEQQSSVSGMIDKNADQLLLTCVNHRGVGELAVSKLLVGTGADASRSWTFRVRLTDANGDPLTVNAWTANGEEKQLTVKETGALVTLDASGMTTLTMRGGETRTITNLPNGTRYSVEEVSANTDGYYTSSSNTTGTIYEKTEEYDGVSRVTFTNRREPGTLTVSKTVGGNAGDVYRPFEFVVTLTAPEGRPGDSLPNPVKARLEDYREGTETELTLPLSEENTVTFELTHDQAMVLLDLDEGTGYSVAETPAAGYVTRVAGDIEGVLSANGTAVAAFTNTANVYREGDDDDDDDDTTRTEERGPGEEPELPVELPNPNKPDSPDTVTILEDDVPTTYVKVPDPENEEEFIYIPEDEIPLQGFEIPETGDNGQTILWAVLSAASLTGIVALGIPSRKKEEEEQ